MSKLFSSTSLGSLALSNHVVMAPMTRSRAVNNIPNDLIAEYYAQRADAGLIITEGTSPSINGLGYARMPGIFSKEQIGAWKKVTQAVHQKGGKIFLQIMHAGRVAHPSNLPKGGEVLAPSSVKLEEAKMWVDGEGQLEIPISREMKKNDIQYAIQEFIQGAKNAIEAGFDGVEVHGANGYLIEQFINRHVNQRTDEYGGTTEKHARFLLEVTGGIVKAIGSDKVGVRLSPYGVASEMPHYTEIDETYEYIARKLNDLDIAYIHVVDHSSMGAPEVPVRVMEKIRANFDNTLILAGNYNAERAEDALAAGQADLIAFGRPFIANPDLVGRLKNKLPLNQPKFDLFYTAGGEGYVDYPVFEDVVVTQ